MRANTIDALAPAATQLEVATQRCKLALWLVSGTLAYNVAEAVFAVWSGKRAGSIALVGFGLDSAIECAAAIGVLWRIWLETRCIDRGIIDRSDRRVQRFVGCTFVALVIYVLAQSTLSLWCRKSPTVSTIGIVLTAASVVFMPWIALSKLRAARLMDSPALRAEAKATLACAFLSVTVLLGLVANAVGGWWWADPLAGCLMIPWLVREGIAGIQAQDRGNDEAETDCFRDSDCE